MSEVELPSPDAALLELDKLARDFSQHEYGLPFYAEGGMNDALPLSDYYSEDLVLDKLRDVMRSYARAAVEAALEAAAVKCECLGVFSDDGTKECAAVIRAMKG